MTRSSGLRGTHVPRLARSGFTLVELLVAMAVIVVLATISLVVVPGVLDQDRTTDGASLTRQWLMIAKARAARDGLPRGVRLITGLDPNNPAKQSPLWVTELQYTESPPVIVPNPSAVGDPAHPRVLFTYTVNSTGAVTNRVCQISGLNYDQAVQVEWNSVLALPLLGTWHRILGPPSAPVYSPALNPSNPGPYTVTVTLDYYPDAQFGAAGQPTGAPEPVYLTYHFGLYAPPRPLLGEPTLQLPKNICIDLNPGVSRPQGFTGQDYDIVFAPSGRVLFRGEGQIYLWVRDYTKVPSMVPISQSPLTYDPDAFRRGGEQQLVSLKTRSGALGVFPVLWPIMTGPNAGQYAAGQDPYWFAIQGATGQ